RVLRPGGRVVISSLRKDADMSKLFVEGARELSERWPKDLQEFNSGIRFEDAIRGYMNEASRLLDLEEAGRFAFWDSRELESLLSSQSFERISVGESFGVPPQAVVAAAVRP